MISPAGQGPLQNSVYDSIAVKRIFQKPCKYYSKFLSEVKKTKPISVPFHFHQNQPAKVQLTACQDKLLKIVGEYISNNSKQLKLCILGGGGVGKSKLIEIVCQKLEQKNLKYVTLGPTGTSAANVSGKTIHSFLKLRNKSGGAFKHMINHPIPRQFVTDVKVLSFIIIDELSLISAQFLNFINLRLQKARKNSLDFGGINIIIVGDLYQLPAFYGSPLYVSPDRIDCEFAANGSRLFRRFQFEFLNENVRQKGDQQYLKLLNNIRNKQVSKEDVELLNSRFENNLSEAEKSEFELDSTFIFATNAECKNYNTKKLKTLEKPVVTIVPKQTPRFPLVDNDQTLELCDGAKIIVTQNLHVNARLCNGSIGYVKAILFDNKTRPNIGMPVCIFCTFERYTGTTCEQNTVPIVPVSDQYFHPVTAQKFTVRQFPIKLGWALTAHRTQSLSLPRISVFLSDREMFLNFAYTVLSRTTSLKGLMILKSEIKMHRFNSQSFYAGYENLKREMEKLCRDKELQKDKTQSVQTQPPSLPIQSSSVEDTSAFDSDGDELICNMEL